MLTLVLALFLAPLAEAKKASAQITPRPHRATASEAVEAAEKSEANGRENCFLAVSITYKLGRHEELEYAFEMENRQACKDLRDLYATSFSQAEVKAKTVTMRWTGGR